MKKEKKKLLIVLALVLLVVLVGVGGISFYFYKDSKIMPKIELVGEGDVKLALGEEFVDEGAKSTYKDEDTSDSIVVLGEVDVNKVGTYELRYISKDEKTGKETSVTRVVHVVDEVGPVITLKGDASKTIYLNDKYEEPGYEAKDNYDGDLTDKVLVSGEVKVDTLGEYELTYVVNDSSNNKYEVKRKVIVIEKPKPKPVTSNNNVNTSGRGLPVLMYHFFYNDLAGETGRDGNWLAVSTFDAQMKYLSDNNYYFPTWQEVEDYVDGKITLPDKSVVITIDDGDVSFIDHAIPIIEKYNVRATSFAITNWNGEWLAQRFNYEGSHLNVQSHSHGAHVYGANGRGRLVNMTYEEALEDVTKSRDLTGGATVFCYPFGHYNDIAINALKAANYRLALTTNGGRVYPGQNKYTLPRVRISRGESMSSFMSKVK